MFYCDKCGKENKYPRMTDKRFKNFGPCEFCDKVKLYNYFSGRMFELGDVDVSPKRLFGEDYKKVLEE